VAGGEGEVPGVVGVGGGGEAGVAGGEGLPRSVGGATGGGGLREFSPLGGIGAKGGLAGGGRAGDDGGSTNPHTSASGQNSPVQSASPPPVPPAWRLPGCWQPIGLPALTSLLSQLIGRLEVTGQPSA
jgi:hypothetical protein